MNPQKQFKLNRQAMLLSVIAAAYPATGYCIAAGRADFVIGDVVAVAADGSRRALVKGSEINAGDAINTADGARAQVRFADGGFISLQPGTVFRIDEFNYQNKTDGQEKGFFSLLKGGLRAITGAIGHVNRNTYKVTTPVATIGIRGTGYNAVLNEGQGLQLSVGEGAVLLSNNVGQIVVTSGNAAFVANISTPPATSTEQPQTPAASIKPITTTTVTQAEQTDSTGKSLIVLPSLVSGPGYKLSYAGINCDDGCGSFTPNTRSGITTTFNSTSQLLQYVDGGEGGGTAALGSATVTFSATDGIIGWGRWDGSTSGGAGPHPLDNGVFHYVVGIPTPAMPTSGTATYSVMGYTTPTTTDGSTIVSGGSVQGNLTADFATAVVGANLTIANTVMTYSVTGTMSRPGSGSSFSGYNGGGLSITAANCNSCSVYMSGFFAGDNASRAGLTYHIHNGYVSDADTSGAVAFAKQ